MYQNSTTAMQNSEKIPGVEPPFCWEGEVKVASSWNYVWLSICQPSTQQRYNMQNNQLEK